MGKYLAFVLTFLFISTASAQPNHVAEAQTFVNDFLTKMSVVLNSESTATKKQAELRAILDNDVALDSIGRFVLGRYWRRATPDERAEYLVLFKDSVIRSTISRIKQLNKQDYKIVKANLVSAEGSTEISVIVQTVILTSDSPIHLNWRVSHNNNKGYRITDVYIMGISLAITYRADYTSVIGKVGVKGLLEKLREKNNQ